MGVFLRVNFRTWPSSRIVCPWCAWEQSSVWDHSVRRGQLCCLNTGNWGHWKCPLVPETSLWVGSSKAGLLCPWQRCLYGDKGANRFCHYKKVNSGHFRKYLAYACMTKLEIDRSPTLAVIFASFPRPHKEIKAQAAFSFTSRLVHLGSGWMVPAAESCCQLVALQWYTWNELETSTQAEKAVK